MLEFLKSIGLGEIFLAALMLMAAVLAVTLLAGYVAYAFVFERDPDDIEFKAAPPKSSDKPDSGSIASA